MAHDTWEYYSALKKKEIYKKMYGFRMHSTKQGDPNPERKKKNNLDFPLYTDPRL